MVKYFLSGAVVLLLAGCSAFDPVIDARREAGMKEPVGWSRPHAPAICYGLTGGRVVADEMAHAECQKLGKRAVFQYEDSFSCTFITPTRAVYRCE